ncbi:hemoglobin/transferrin/lactoferrin receptor protein [Orbus hercynius]|uniref:Hemoglobin/transferrin/lactoferrin receptor protein n=1 Tax=Orbus hercynius TaxID=593135 RepID=A0A495RKA3_9GAMM|nr:TonB-dependent receptor [Orbus hercynius]RKS87744.1 hemoglobin/transferrin/lactoferrin receptor protein [Orbus hercynius]
MKLFRQACVSCFMPLLAAIPITEVSAQETVNSKAKNKVASALDTIIVTSERSEKSIWESPMPVAVVNSDEIKKQNGDSIIETLRDIPGVEISDNSLAGRKQIMIRGEEPSRVLILVDGQELTYHRSGHGSSAGVLIDMESVERIEVVKGPNSVLYGSQAIGGVVNFITRKGSEDQKKFNAHFKSIYNGATDGFTEQGSIYGTVDNFDYRLSGTYSDQGDRKTKEGRLKNTDFDNNSASAWLGYRLDQHKFGMSLEHYKVDTSTYYNLASGSPEIKEFSLKIPKLARDKIGLFYDYDVDSNLIDKIHVDGYYQRLERQFRNNILIVPIATMKIGTNTHTDDTQNSVGLTSQINWKLHPDINLITGAQYQRDDVKQTSLTQNTINTPIPSRDYVERSLQNNKWQQSTIAVFAQNDWSLTKDINWNIGIRQYWIESELKKGHSTQTKTPVSGSQTSTTTVDSPRTDHHHNFVVATGMTYQGIENTLLRASFAQGYVYPTLAHLYGITAAHSQVLYGNPDLKPEKSNNYEIGLRFNNNRWLIDSAIYYSDAKNYITDQYCNGSAICNGAVGSTNQYYINADKARTYGVELSIEYLDWDFVPYLTANYIRRQLHTSSYQTFDSGSPALSSTFGVKNSTIWDAINTDFDSNLFIRAATDTAKRSGDDTYHYSGWATLNFSLTASFGRERQYQIGIDLNNLLNKNYTTARETIPAAKFNTVISASLLF